MRTAKTILAIAAVISSASNAQQRPVQLRMTKELRIDGDAESLVGFGTVAIGPAGQIVIPQGRDAQILLYDNRGRRIGRFGRKGQGPGEFDAMYGQFGWVGDTIWIHDFNQRRLTFVSSSLKLIRTQPWSERPKNAPSSNPRDGPSSMSLVRFYADGSQLIRWFFDRPDPKTRARSDARYVIVDRNGNMGRDFAKIPANPNIVFVPEMPGLGVNIPFAPQPLSAAAPDGKRVGIVSLPTITGSQGSYRVTVVRSTGDTVFSTSYPYTPERVPASAKSDALDRMDRMYRRVITEGPDAGPRPADKIMGLVRPRVPGTYPPAVGMLLGMDETVWLQLNYADTPTRHRILDGKGAIIGDVVLPPRSILAAATRALAWVVELDADGVPSLVRYRISLP